jgi:hypothetical protein
MSAIPDEIMDEAKLLRNTVLWASNSSIIAIAKALLAAEQRGAERERERLRPLLEGQSMVKMDGLTGYLSDAAAIRNTKE